MATRTVRDLLISGVIVLVIAATLYGLRGWKEAKEEETRQEIRATATRQVAETICRNRTEAIWQSLEATMRDDRDPMAQAKAVELFRRTMTGQTLSREKYEQACVEYEIERGRRRDGRR
jgi:hypothetical protein